MGEPKPLLEIIRLAWERSGGRGRMTREFVARWLEAHPDYARWGLSTRFHSGSALPIMGNTRMTRVMQAWLAAGHPGPGKTGFSWGDFQAFADSYTDEFLELEDSTEVIALTGEGKAIVR